VRSRSRPASRWVSRATARTASAWGLGTLARTAFPDCRTVVEETLACGDTVVMRNWFEGTHLGPFLGHPPTGRRFRFRQVHWMRFAPDGAVVEHWGVRDDVTQLRQLGLPIPGS
jgi:predicted ester cyclase